MVGGGMSTEAQSFADLVRAEYGSSADLDTIRKAFTKRFGPIVLAIRGKYCVRGDAHRPRGGDT